MMTKVLLAGALLVGGFSGSAGADGVPLEWNAHAEWFMYAPSFAFREVPGAARYRFRTIDDCHVVRDFTADRPTDSLAPVWEKLPKGFVTVTCFALDGKDAVVGLAGERTFWKNAPFKEGAYPKAKRSYAEAVNLGLEYLLDRPSNRYFLEKGVPDPSYDLNCYPAKLIRAYLACHKATGDALALAKAKALGDAAVCNQRENGLSPTGWFGNYDQYHNWINCHIGTIMALQELDGATSNWRNPE